jgi:hypothetical protein
MALQHSRSVALAVLCMSVLLCSWKGEDIFYKEYCVVSCRGSGIVWFQTSGDKPPVDPKHESRERDQG